MHILYSIPGVRKILLVIGNFIFNFRYAHYFGNSVTIFGFPIIRVEKGSKVCIGKRLILISNPYFSEPGINHPVMIRTINPDAIIEIGNDVGMSGGGVVAARSVKIGNKVMIGANTLIMDTDFHPVAPENRRYSRDNVHCEEVIIEDNVFIGMDAKIMKGVRIGENSVVAAGSIVTKNIPPNSMAAGIPAKIVKSI